jgi:hypothetical protein
MLAGRFLTPSLLTARCVRRLEVQHTRVLVVQAYSMTLAVCIVSFETAASVQGVQLAVMCLHAYNACICA